MTNANRVLILMSTYNAEKYLVEQIKSLREQRNVCVSILCRDDGSTDNTIHILKSLGIDYYTGGNLGPARSFMDLVENVPRHMSITRSVIKMIIGIQIN